MPNSTDTMLITGQIITSHLLDRDKLNRRTMNAIRREIQNNSGPFLGDILTKLLEKHAVLDQDITMLQERAINRLNGVEE